MEVYTVDLYSTGERWHSFVCVSLEKALECIAASYGITEHVYTGIGGEWVRYQNPKDQTQTAGISRRPVVE